MADPAAGIGDGHQERVAVGASEQGCDGVLVLEVQLLAPAPSRDMQRVPHVEQSRVRLVDAAVGTVGEPGSGERTQHGHVA